MALFIVRTTFHYYRRVKIGRKRGYLASLLTPYALATPGGPNWPCPHPKAQEGAIMSFVPPPKKTPKKLLFYLR